MNSLKEEGYLQPREDTRVVLVNSVDQIKKRHERFGNPMTHVAILVSCRLEDHCYDWIVC